MSAAPSTIVSKVWNYAHVLKNAGVGYGDYVEQITYLLFLKLAEEMADLAYENPIPEQYSWSTLSKTSGDDLEVHYRHTLESLGKERGLVGIIYRKAQNKISNPSDLARVVKMIGDPACGTGGFLLAAYEHILTHYKLDKRELTHLKTEALWGTDIVDSVVRLCAMNLYLHGIGKVAEASRLSSQKPRDRLPLPRSTEPTPSLSPAARGST